MFHQKGEGSPDSKLDECDMNDESDAQERDDEDWNLSSAEIAFEECTICDTDIMTSELFTVELEKVDYRELT